MMLKTTYVRKLNDAFMPAAHFTIDKNTPHEDVVMDYPPKGTPEYYAIRTEVNRKAGEFQGDLTFEGF